jgi:hypothetical protein
LVNHCSTPTIISLSSNTEGKHDFCSTCSCVGKDHHIMEITCKSKVMLIHVEDVGWDADSLDRSIDQLGCTIA